MGRPPSLFPKRDRDLWYRQQNAEKLRRQDRERYAAKRDQKLGHRSEYYWANRDRIRAMERWRITGFSPEYFNAKMESQGNVCAICGSDTPTGRWQEWTADHDHETGQLRGVLCSVCNASIGIGLENLRRAVRYLESYQHGEKQGPIQMPPKLRRLPKEAHESAAEYDTARASGSKTWGFRG
jgi:hypothetical protein